MEALDGKRVLGVVRFINDGSKTGLIGLGSRTGKPGTAATFSRWLTRPGAVQEPGHDLGPTGQSVTISVALRFAHKLARHTLTLELGATDQQGNREPFRAGGAVAVK